MIQIPFASLVMVVRSNAVNSSQFSQQKCFADCFTDWHNILNEDVHVTLCLEQEHAGYYDVNSTLDGNPSGIRAFDCSCKEAVSICIGGCIHM